jgi:pyruvate formate-lyase/glycerol dehydratase family glycyl radical enzyme
MEAKISDRIEFLKQRLKSSYSAKMASQRKEIYERVFGENQSESQVIRMAKGLAAFLREKEILMCQEDLLAGHEQSYDYSVPPAGENPPISAEEKETMDQFYRGYRIGLYCGGLGGHVIAGYDRVLHIGFGKLTDMARDKIDNSTGSERDFALASLTVCEAVTDYILRYAAMAEQLAKEAISEKYSEQLKKIALACQWVANNPPRTFFEAIQLFWLTHEIITCEQGSGSLSLGRLDQYLYSYYAKDIADGILTYEEASELIEALWIKFAGIRRGFQHVVLGGRLNGKGYAANDLSYMCLQATKKLRLDQPLISVRWDRDMPNAFWNKILELIQLGMGFPALFNDEVAITAKHRLGISREDAENYGIVGCVELSIPGKEFSHTEELRVNWAKVLELMLNDGVCPVTGEAMKLKNELKLDDINSYEEFYQWYKREFEHFINLGIRGANINDRNFPYHVPYPYLSSTMEGCLKAGRDVTAGSTVYNLSTVNGCGMANTADSLVAIKHIVYNDKRFSLSELASILHNGFENAESLKDALGTKNPKFGNDNDEPDSIMRDLADAFCHQIESYHNPRGGRFQTGLYTVDWHAIVGKITGNLPDGHLHGTALANALSPSQGSDASGPTAVIKSITKLDHTLLGNGMVLDIKFHPDFFADEKCKESFKHLVETYFQLGGLEIQFNVISRKTLLEAQNSPELYRDLIVRVSGFSAYFVDLDKIIQDEIITRTEHFAI